MIFLWVGTSIKPDNLYKLVLDYRRSGCNNIGFNDNDLDSRDQLQDTSVQHGTDDAQSVPNTIEVNEPTKIKRKNTTKTTAKT